MTSPDDEKLLDAVRTRSDFLKRDLEEERTMKAAVPLVAGANLSRRALLVCAATVVSGLPVALASASGLIFAASVTDAMNKAAIASATMLFMSFASYGFVSVPKRLLAAFQHLAAGLLVSSVAVELVPTIMDAPRDLLSTVAIFAGFIVGTASFFVLGHFCGEPEAEDSTSPPASARTPRGLTKMAHKERAEREARPAYPAALVAAVVVDAAVDGFLIGLASAAGELANSGVVLAVALAIEMGFTGLVYASTLRKQSSVAGLASVVAPPLVLLFASAAGAAASSALIAYPSAHVAVVSFGTTALLYLVVVELLREAHESMGEETTWIELMFFVGFFTALLLERAMAAPA